ncbi:apolipoprotein N-acyltransferase [Novosphingobium sp. FSY-8]|uniref:Apolipoprotein N-acyltransferase n=1 Tax=Novosphingobium ovatum TaxID=1908523 RepID=A0ABW9XEY4_9SPHN|nr:apolipoprotein N-acyltransferase [Novosphingobium ovatum]NBC37069.1 apolipoprotein N-acyltransferase [Novosphingobium ovatum]
MAKLTDAQRAQLKLKLRLWGRKWWNRIWPAGAVIALGAGGATGFEPWHLWPLTLLSIAGLGWLVSRVAGPGWAFFCGWLWGVGHFSAGNNWIATAFTYQSKMPAALGGAAVVGLSLYLAVWPGLAALLAWYFRDRPVARVTGFAGAWILAELGRAWVITGFAWNPLGAVLLGGFAHPGLAGLAPWLGTYGLSGLVVLLAGCLGEGVRLWRDIRAALALRPANDDGADPRRALRVAGALVAGPLVLVGAGMVWPTPAERVGRVAYTLIQPNVSQEDLDDPAHFDAQFRQSAALSAPRPGPHWRAGQPRLVLWPESGVPEFVRDGYPAWYYAYTFGNDPWLARLRLGRVIGPGGVLLTGTVDLDLKGEEAVGGQNVITAINDQGKITATYAKAHLVPFGEYLPFRSILKPLGLERLVPGNIDFRPGPGPATVDLGPLGRAGMQICYEIIFSGQTTDRAHRADYLFNPSNDGWFGAWGPPQHLAQARLRAIEEGLPVLRSTTNGVSAVVDSSGVVRAHVPRYQAGRLDGLIPAASAPTWFSRWGNMVPVAIAVLLLGASTLVLRSRRG